MAGVAGFKRLGTGAVAACVIALGVAGAAQAEPGGTFTASVGQMAFPATAIGEQSAVQTITFTGHSDLDHPVLSAAKVADATSEVRDFVVVEDRCAGRELYKGDDCVVRVAYAPTSDRVTAADLTVSAGGHEESVLLTGTIADPVVTPTPTPDPAPAAPVVEALPAPAAIAPAVAPVVVVKPAQVTKSATCVKASSKKVVCTLKLGLATTTKVKASLMKGKAVKASSSRKGDGKITLKSSKKLKANTYTLKLTVAGKTAMRTSVKLG